MNSEEMTPEERARQVARLRLRAEDGSAAAQYRLAKQYQAGDGVAVDLAEAFRWFSEAALHDHAASLFELGLMFRFGHGVERDLVTAARCHIIAAFLGELGAQGQLADYLEELQDLALAGNQTASRFLCDIHHRGLGVDRNAPLTWTWVRWAKERCALPGDEDDADAEWLETAEALYRTLLTQTDRREGERVLASLVHAASGPRPAGVKQGKRGTARGEGGSRKSA
jgi:TPR repeat protein